MTTHDPCHAFLSKCKRTTQICFQAVRFILPLAMVLPAMAQMPENGNRYVSANGNDSSAGTSWAAPLADLATAQSGSANSCPSSGPCVIHVAAVGITISSAFTLSRANTTIECESGGTLTTTSSTNPFKIAADDTRVTGCAFVYGGSGASENAIDIETPSSASVQRVSIDHNLFENYPGGSGANVVVFVGDRSNKAAGVAVTDVHVTDNVFYGNTGNHISIMDNAQRIDVSRNLVYTGSGISGSNDEIINAQTADALTVGSGGTTIQGLTVSGNIMFHGLTGDCIQIQRLASTGGGPISDVTVSSNVCTLLSGSTGTGYSMAGIVGLSDVGNVFDANGVEMSGNDNAPFEFVNVENGAASGNSAIMGTQSSAAALLIFTVIGNNGQISNVAFTGNSASIAFTNTAPNYAACWSVGSGGSSVNTIVRNTFTGNSCDLTGSTGEAVGFYMQGGGNTSNQVSNNFISENNFLSPSGPNSAVGIVLQPESGTMVNNIVGFNNLTNFNIPYCHNLASCPGTTGLLSSTLATLSYGSNLSQAALH
jgi:hypothetical protein